MKINDKTFDKWEVSDLYTILNEETFRECEYIDYKRNFAFLECKDKNDKKKKQDEFRHDICSFANSEGGYLFFGIEEEGGIPTNLSGVEIQDENTDKFELDRRNENSLILPVIPQIDYRFFKLENGKYIIVIHIAKGFHRPYVCRDNSGEFKFYMRRGNKKESMSYTEIRMMFNQSLALADEIKRFRKEKANDIIRDKVDEETKQYHPFALIQIIPESFMDVNTHMSLYDMFLRKEINFTQTFSCCFRHAVPNVDGVSYPNYGYDNGVLFQAYNSGIIEEQYEISIRDNGNKSWIGVSSLKDQITGLIEGSSHFYKRIGRNVKVYICISIFGCKGKCSDEDFERNYLGIVDRNEIYCMPLEVMNLSDEDQVTAAVAQADIIVDNALGRHRLGENR